eukprot:CAMPEP_0116540942 /NCGR_PEP_ID=MMETSP0397-20121206/219_1 /TAXON_ID=216820 /ORGANISM="Cyclophora tenuis, Strain ECT3854" /LENGTH=191 /DNA_ID=CAMNT_0004064853 /DNA_START=187 /DNA_END=762 /DNA_ORIENTATION=-
MVPLRIERPNDDLGATLLLSWPTVITHEIDIYSPLHPHKIQRYQLDGHGLYLREVDGVTGTNDMVCCPICGETFGDYDRLRKHIIHNQNYEAFNTYPIEGTHQSLDLDDFQDPIPPTMQEIQRNFPQEIVCLIEGIDPLLSGTFQALHSYTMSDIAWSGKFSDCVSVTRQQKAKLELHNFHKVEREKYTDS